MSTDSNNKRIAKNTLFLYLRMILLLVISLYTSRIILNALGIKDYGIYNVVAGFVTMFSLVSSSLSTAIGRFLNYELGLNSSLERLNKVFCASVTIQVILCLIILFLGETIGLWFLNTQMVIPDDRIAAANWCYQFSLIAFIFNIISIPYNATIIAHEKMSAFAYISILEATCRLAIAFCISISPIVSHQ